MSGQSAEQQVCGTAVSAKSERPNVIVVMTDQQRADVSRREGFALDTTPFLDELAERGTWFNKAYTAAPICVAARCSMLTGRFPAANGVRENSAAANVRYSSDLFDVMKGEGYATGLIGKNHTYLTPQSPSVDHFQKIEHYGYAGPYASEEESAFIHWLRDCSVYETEPTPFSAALQNPSRAVTSSLDWIDSVAGEKPFFLWLSIPEPHNPYQVPEPYYSLFPPEELPPLTATAGILQDKGLKWQSCREASEKFDPQFDANLNRIRSNYFGMLRLIDDQLQRLVNSLESRGQLKNTIIVFLSDHGDFVGEYGLIKKGPELPDILLRIPLLFAGPGIRASALPHEAHVSIVDLLPTLCEAIGAVPPPGVQGRSLWPLLTGADYPAEEFASIYAEHGYGGLELSEEDGVRACDSGSIRKREDGSERIRYDELNPITQSGFMRSVRKGGWKLNLSMQGKAELYNLARDPLELDNLWGQPDTNAVQSELLLELAVWMMRSEDPLPYPGKYKYKRDLRGYLAPYRHL
jgi:arylsulfatase A-like enzyme